MATEVAITAADLCHAFEAVLEQIPEHPLTDWVQQAHVVAGGMRPGNTAFMRKLLVNRFGGHLQKYDKNVAGFLRNHMPEARLLSMLDAEELQKRRGLLTVFFGKARFILALLQDARETVRDDAARWMNENTAELPEEEVAQKQVRAIFAPVANLGQGGSPEGNKRLREALTLAEQQIETLKKEAKRDRRMAEEAAQKREREQRDLLATKDFAIAEAKRLAEQADAALQRETALRDLRVKELLAVRQVDLFRGWLKPMCAVETLLEEGKHKPLLERVQVVLEAQRRADRAASRHHEAEQQLKAVEAALAEVEQTLSVAQVVLPELQAVCDELRVQRDAYRTQLYPEKSAFSALATELAARIDRCTEADYYQVREWLKLNEELKVISAAEAKALRTRFNHRVALWAATHPELKAEDLVLEPESESDAIRRRNPILADAIAGKREMMLFLDGHNMLNGINRFRQRRGRPQTHEEARTRLEKEVARLFGQLPLVAVNLVWDGCAKTNHNLCENVLVHFSGGTGEHRADRYIINQIDYYKDQTDLPMVLVTDDNGFAGDARKRGVQVCRLHDFEAFLDVPLA
ncbi:MAG: hypothetical protein IKW23_06625 [Kiritimatiellae bacterium]|nr:hypothetical protein [Kiritimatiellia bacterium]